MFKTGGELLDVSGTNPEFRSNLGGRWQNVTILTIIIFIIIIIIIVIIIIVILCYLNYFLVLM